jgi:hypothetical protein
MFQPQGRAHSVSNSMMKPRHKNRLIIVSGDNELLNRTVAMKIDASINERLNRRGSLSAVGC